MHKQVISFVLVAHALLARGAAAMQAPSTGHTCREYFDGLARKIEEDYAGFRLEVRGARRQEYDRLAARLRELAQRTEVDDCYPILRALVASLDDPHLFVFQSTRVDSAEAARRALAVRRRPIAESQVRDALRRRRHALDPIEGIWTDGRLRVAILAGRAAGYFDAIVLTPDSTTWSDGDVRATFRRTTSGYEAELLGREFARRTLDTRVHKRVLLRLSPEIWGKEYPVAAEDAGVVDPRDPRRPTVLLRQGTVVFNIPSHAPQYRSVLDSLVAKYAPALRGAERLIIDLRGNEGGSAFVTNALLSYVMSENQRADPYPDRGGPVMLATPDQIAYARTSFGSDTTRFVRTLLERLTASPGQFVPLEEPGNPQPSSRPDSLIYGPRRVGVLVDGGTVSAGEALVLKALRSTRATVFGEPTAGALDYQSVNIVRIVPSPGRWLLGYPTIARDTLLPDHGMRGHGIAPDVPMRWLQLQDPINEVDAWLRKH